MPIYLPIMVGAKFSGFTPMSIGNLIYINSLKNLQTPLKGLDRPEECQSNVTGETQRESIALDSITGACLWTLSGPLTVEVLKKERL